MSAADAARKARKKLPALPVVLKQLELRVREKPHTREELAAWLDAGGHSWTQWDGERLSEQQYEAADGSLKTALEALLVNPHIDLQEHEGARMYVYRTTFAFRDRRSLAAALAGARSGTPLSTIIADVKEEYPTVRQDVEQLLKEGVIFAIDDDKGARKDKVLFPSIDRGSVAALYANRDARMHFREISMPEHTRVVDELQATSFRLPDELYRRRRDRIMAIAGAQGGGAGERRPARKGARKRPGPGARR